MMKYGARNQIVAKVTGVKKGTVMGQVNLEIPGNCCMSSVMTLDSVEDMGLKEGDKVKLVIKAIHVLVVKED